jgi:hypothetical protein
MLGVPETRSQRMTAERVEPRTLALERGCEAAAPRHFDFRAKTDDFRMVASLDRKRLGAKTDPECLKLIRGVFDKETRRKPLAFAADAVRYGNWIDFGLQVAVTRGIAG